MAGSLLVIPLVKNRSKNAGRADDRHDGFGAEFLVLSVMATRTRQLALLGRRSLELQQFG